MKLLALQTDLREALQLNLSGLLVEGDLIASFVGLPALVRLPGD